MKLAFAIPLMVLTASLHAAAQEFRNLNVDSMDFTVGDRLEIDQAENVWKFLGGADIVLHAADAADGTMRVRASTITIALGGEEGSEVQSVVMENRVVVDHPDGTIRADHGTWNVSTGQLEFTGNPILTLDMAKELKCDRLEINLKEGTSKLHGAEASGVRFGGLGGGSGPSSPYLLGVDSVTDWPALIGHLQDARDAERDTPGARVISTVPQDARATLGNLDRTKEPIDSFKKAIVKQLNEVLTQSTLYSQEAWQGIAIPADAQTLLEKGVGKLTETELIHLNRRLLEAAYPEAIAQAPAEEN